MKGKLNVPLLITIIGASIIIIIFAIIIISRFFKPILKDDLDKQPQKETVISQQNDQETYNPYADEPFIVNSLDDGDMTTDELYQAYYDTVTVSTSKEGTNSGIRCKVHLYFEYPEIYNFLNDVQVFQDNKAIEFGITEDIRNVEFTTDSLKHKFILRIGDYESEVFRYKDIELNFNND